MKINIGLDFDGVIADCLKLKSLWAKNLYGVIIPPERFKRELAVGEGYLTLEQYRAVQVLVYGDRDIALQMEPVDGMLYFLPRLIKEGHEVRVITSRSEVMLAIAEEWTALRGLDLNFTGVGRQVSKADASKGLDVFIDDDLDKLVPLMDIVPHRFLFSWEYNSHIKEEGIATRVASWSDFYEKITRIAKTLEAP